MNSIVLYGCETWTLSKELEKRLTAFENRCFRRILKVPYAAHRTNHSIREEITLYIEDFTSPIDNIKKRKLAFYGHRNRDHGSLSNIILQGRVEGSRGRGRPRTRWIDNITRWTGIDIQDVHERSMDRAVWRDTTSRIIHMPQRAANSKKSEKKERKKWKSDNRNGKK